MCFIECFNEMCMIKPRTAWLNKSFSVDSNISFYVHTYSAIRMYIRRTDKQSNRGYIDLLYL